jgi:hypothetical protein
MIEESQTTCNWPPVLREEPHSDADAGHNVSGPTIKTTDQLIEEILTEYAEAWRELANL